MTTSRHLSAAKLRTLELLGTGPAFRKFRTNRAGDYSWFHGEDARPVTGTLHALFTLGLATVLEDNKDVAVITERGRAVLRNARPSPETTRTKPRTLPPLLALAA